MRSGPVEDDKLVGQLARMLNLDKSDVVDAQWVDNGPGWVALMLADAAAVLALRPGTVDRLVGVVGAYPPGTARPTKCGRFSPKTVPPSRTLLPGASTPLWPSGSRRWGLSGPRTSPARERPSGAKGEPTSTKTLMGPSGWAGARLPA